MTYTRLPKTLSATLRAAGLTVVEVDGWETRGRPASTGGFSPKGVLCHHTATGPKTSNAAVVNLLVNGRSDLPGPLCHLGLARNGTVYVIASGRANHAGKAKSSGNMPSGDGNTEYIGIEAFNNGVGEPWAKPQMDAYVLLCAVLSVKLTKNTASSVRGHKETSVTGKIDPTFAMAPFRNDVAAKIKLLTAVKPILGVTGIKAPKTAPAKWNGFDHLKPSGYMDYWTAVAEEDAVDVDVQKDAEGGLWALHWNNVAKNGLYDPLGKIKGSAMISNLSTKEVARLRAIKFHGKKAHSIASIIDRAWANKTRIELEFKVGISLAKAKQLMSRPKTKLLHLAGLLQTKTLAAITGAPQRLVPLQEAGFITILSFTGYKGPGIRKVLAWPVTDYTRGKTKWL